jgi:hypothetical protein
MMMMMILYGVISTWGSIDSLLVFYHLYAAKLNPSPPKFKIPVIRVTEHELISH